MVAEHVKRHTQTWIGRMNLLLRQIRFYYDEWTAGLLLQNDLTLFLANAPMRGTPDYGEWTAGLLLQNDLTLLWRMDRWTATAE
jgi:hypothetical protein